MKKYIPVILLLAIPAFLFSQTQYQHWQWAKAFGGIGNDITVDMKIKNGFLYVTGTFTSPQINWDGTILNNHGGQDIFIAKMDTLGNTVWVKSFGGGGDDEVKQLEMNSNGAMVMRCSSASATVTIGSSTLNNPANFYATIGIDGSVLNSVVLPVGPSYPDIDIDNEKNIYVSAAYTFPFEFAGVLIDSVFGLAGAAALKYDNLGNPEWYKNLQVRSNEYLPFVNINHNPFDTTTGPYWYYLPAVTGDAYASMKIEYNEKDTVLGIICSYFRHAQINNGGTFGYFYADSPNEKPKAMHMKISKDGTARLTSFCTQFYTFSGGWVSDFKTTASGHSYTTWGYHSLGGTFGFNFSRERADILEQETEFGYNYNYFSNSVPPPAFSPMEINEAGNYLLCKDIPEYAWPTDSDNRNVVILDTNFNEIKETNVAEINSLNLSIKSMVDTNAIYFGSNFSDSNLLLNQNYPRASFTLNNNGGQEIFIGKYAFGVCKNSAVVQNVYVCNGSSYTFPDKTVMVNLINNTSYNGTIPSTFGCDSIITTNISITHTDTNITKHTIYFTASANTSYQWLDCISGNNITGEKNQAFTAHSIGSYAVQVSKDGCIDTSGCYTVTAEDMLAGGRQLISIYPMPTRGRYTLIIQAEKPTMASLSLIDFAGTTIKTEKINLSFGKNIIQQNISSLAAGRYTLVVRKTSAGETITKTIIKL